MDANWHRLRMMAVSMMLASSTAACTLFSGPDGNPVVDGGANSPVAAASSAERPVVEVVLPQAMHLPPMDPGATPRTPLGALRSRYLPVWSADLDWAFPPDTCGSAWELDGIAAPASGVEISQYGDPPTMAALAVMRYEDLMSRAFAQPTPLGQLCVAVGSVPPQRSEALENLARSIARSEAEAPTHLQPRAVTLLAVGPNSALAVACIQETLQETQDSSPRESTTATTVRLRAYLLRVAQGLEDSIYDVSYRVADVSTESAANCEALDNWIGEWIHAVERWLDEGQIWTILPVTRDAISVCSHDANRGEAICAEK